MSLRFAGGVLRVSCLFEEKRKGGNERDQEKLKVTNNELVSQIEGLNSSDKGKELKKVKEELQSMCKNKLNIEEDFRVVLGENERNCARLKTLESTIEALHELLSSEKSKNAEMIQVNIENNIGTQDNPTQVLNQSESNINNDIESDDNNALTEDTTEHEEEIIGNNDDNSVNVELRGIIVQDDPRDTDVRHIKTDEVDSRDGDIRPESSDYEPSRKQYCHFWNNGHCRYSDNL